MIVDTVFGTMFASLGAHRLLIHLSFPKFFHRRFNVVSAESSLA